MIQVASGPHGRVDALSWNASERVQGKRIKIKGFPKTARCAPVPG